MFLTPLAKEMHLSVLAVYGGTSYSKHRRALEKGVDIVVACPGRLIDLMEQGSISLENVEIAVLDEADRMADMGFIDPVCFILTIVINIAKSFFTVQHWIVKFQK